MKVLWTDGSAAPNPGPGGYAVVEVGREFTGAEVVEVLTVGGVERRMELGNFGGGRTTSGEGRMASGGKSKSLKVKVTKLADGQVAWPVRLGREAQSTNIRMEGRAMIAAMKYAGTEGCEIHSDSEFWINVLTKWAPGWQARGWRKARGEIQNLDIVKELYGLYLQYPVKLVWVRGHVGVEANELADRWANLAREA